MQRIQTSLILAVTTLLGAAAPMVAAAEAIGEIRMARGEAYVERSGSHLAATRGMPVQRADVLRTGADGRIAVVFTDESRFSLGTDSSLALEHFEFDRKSGRGALEVRMDAGALAVSTGRISKGAPDALKVRTPTTILGARGTEFIVEVND